MEAELHASKQQEDVYRALFMKYDSYVYTIVWNRISNVGTREDAEEVVSDVFLALFRNFDKIEDGKLESYLRKLAIRTAIDKYRQLTSRHELPVEELPDAPSDEDIEADHEQAAMRRTLLEAISSLGEPDSRIILYKYFYDCSAGEIGRLVGMNQIAVRKRLSRARTKLRKLLSGMDISL